MHLLIIAAGNVAINFQIYGPLKAFALEEPLIRLYFRGNSPRHKITQSSKNRHYTIQNFRRHRHTKICSKFENKNLSSGAHCYRTRQNKHESTTKNIGSYWGRVHCLRYDNDAIQLLKESA